MPETTIHPRNERLGQLVSALGVSKNKFAKAVGTSSAVISQATIKDHNYSVGLASSILKAFPQVSGQWLLTGEGPMFNDSAPVTPTAAPAKVPAPAAAPDTLGAVYELLRARCTAPLTAATLHRLALHVAACVTNPKVALAALPTSPAPRSPQFFNPFAAPIPINETPEFLD